MKHVIKIDGMGGDLEVLEVKIGEATVDMVENYDFGKIVEALDDAGYDVLGYEVLD